MMNNLFLSIASLQLTACYVILFVLFLRFCLQKQPKIYAYALWSVVLFRLLCPFSVESVLSLIPKQTEAPQAIITQTFSPATVPLTNPETTVPVGNLIDLPTVPLTQTVTEPTFDWQSLLPYLWLLGIAVLLIYSLVGLVKLKQRLNQAELLRDGIYSVSGLETAFVLGIVKPNIYLPEGLSPEEQEYILLHEQTHLRRGDHIIKILAFAALCLHWFNPLVWLAFLLSSQDMEMSCDEAVIAKLGSGVKKAYSSSLLSLAAGKRLLRATPLAFGEGDTKLRIKNVLNYKKPAFWVSVLLAAAILFVGVGLVCDPVSEKETPTATITQEEAEDQMQLFFPEPYKLEADGSRNVVGDDAKDWLYNVYLDINKTVSKTESVLETQQIYRIAIDGSNRDLWKQSEREWTLYWDYLAIDYETLWSNRTDYIGDSVKVSQIAGNLPYPDYVTYEGISVQSSKEPYGLTLNLSVENDEDRDRIAFRVTNDWELILRSLIGNFGEFNYKVKGPTGSTSSTRSYEDNSELYAASATLEGFINALIDQESRRRSVDAESNSMHFNQIEGMKRAALYYMTWPEGCSCEELDWGLVEYDYLVTITLRSDKVPQSLMTAGTEEEQLLRRNAAAMMQAFPASKIEYHFEGSDEVLTYSQWESEDGFIREEERSAAEDEAEYLRTVIESIWTLNPTSVTFPAYDQSNGYNDEIMGIEPFNVDLQLPEGWSIKSGQPLDGKYYCSLGLWTPLEIYNEKSVKVGSIAYNTYQKYEGAEDLPQAIYSGIAVANHYAYNCQESTYQVRKEHSYGTTAITEVYISAMMSETLGFGGSEVINKGILCYNRDLDVYVAVELDEAVDDSIVQSIADSIGISGTEAAENAIPTISESEFADDFALFETYFLGHWLDENGETQSLTYEEDSLITGAQHCIGMAEDEENAYILFLGGGTGQLYRLKKSEPNTLYYYGDWNSNPLYNMAQEPVLYERRDTDTVYSTDVTDPGPMSQLAREKLQAQYGILLEAVGFEVTAEDGSRWEANSDIHLPEERFWLSEKATANEVVFIRQLFSADGSSVGRHDIQITAKKQDGEWIVSKADVLGETEPAVILE